MLKKNWLASTTLSPTHLTCTSLWFPHSRSYYPIVFPKENLKHLHLFPFQLNNVQAVSIALSSWCLHIPPHKLGGTQKTESPKPTVKARFNLLFWIQISGGVGLWSGSRRKNIWNDVMLRELTCCRASLTNKFRVRRLSSKKNKLNHTTERKNKKLTLCIKLFIWGDRNKRDSI